MAQRNHRTNAQGSNDHEPAESREATRPGDSALYHHRNAAFHHESAAHHHRQAAKQRDAGNHQEADLHARAANTHGEEASSHGRNARAAGETEARRNGGNESGRLATHGSKVERGFDEDDRDDERDSRRREQHDAARTGGHDDRGENGTTRGASRHSS